MKAWCLVSMQTPSQRTFLILKNRTIMQRFCIIQDSGRIVKQELAIPENQAARQELVMNDLRRPLCFIATICYVDIYYLHLYLW